MSLRTAFLPGAMTLFLPIALTVQARAQWLVQSEVGADRYWGGSIETNGEHRSFRPYRPTMFAIGLERRGKSIGMGVQVCYSEAALGLEGEGAVAAVEGVFTVVGLSPEVIYRLATLGPVSELRIHAGPLIERWDIIDEDSKTRLGVQSGLSLDVPLGGRFAGSALVQVAVTPSPFEAGQLGDGFEPRTLWRRRFAAGLHFRL